MFAINEQVIVDAMICLKADRVPADAALLWQHNMRISLIAGDKAFANDMMCEETAWRLGGDMMCLGHVFHIRFTFSVATNLDSPVSHSPPPAQLYSRTRCIARARKYGRRRETAG